MSHMIPPMLSTTPPPLGDPHEEDEDEEDFGDFTSADYSFQIDGDENESPRHVPSIKDPWPPLDDFHPETVETVPAEILKEPWPPSENPVETAPVAMPASVNDSWPPREELHPEPIQPAEVIVNGVQNHDVTDEEVEEELKDSSVCAPPDNTSQNSVVSANTDSGLCSASDEASPLPPACTESTDLPSQVSSASDATLVWTNHIETNSLESPMSTNCYSLLAENNNDNDTLSTVPAFSSQSISIVNEDDSQTNCDLILTPQSEDECENGVNSMEDISVSEMSSTLKNEGEGVPLSDLANDFGDHTNATSNISLSSLPTDLSPTETENSSNPLDSSDNFQSIAVNQTSTLQDDTLSFGDFESVSSDACTNNKTDVPELSLDKSKEYDNLENNSSSFENNDDFGEFESVSNQVMTDLDYNKDNISLLNQESSSVRSLGNDDEFCDFSSAAVTTADDDFGDFEVAPVSEDIVEPWADSTLASDDASTTQASAEGWAEPFAEATSSSTAAVTNSSSTVEAQDDDDDDFDDFESAVDSTPTVTSQPLGPDLVALVTQLFPVPPNMHFEEQIAPPLTSWLPAERGPQPSLWPLLRDVQSTPALDFQWASSSSHKCLLGALGIDSRNIMFGQRWNANMPRFAANLGQSPLEPVRADMMSSSHSVAGSSPGVSEEVQVPAAQFDWTGSGLVNPLDSSHATLLLDLDFLATFDNFASPSAPAAAWRTLAASKQTEEAIQLQKNTVKPPDLTLEPIKSAELPLEPVRSPDLALETKVAVKTSELSLEPKTTRSSELILNAGELSTAARHVLLSLPDLSYMRSGHLKPKPLP